MNKKALFVTYGGGHAAMILPVVHELIRSATIDFECLALTTAGPIFNRAGIPYKGFRDFLGPDDAEAKAIGIELVRSHHSQESGIDQDEAVAYLGLSYRDLVAQYGETGAAEQWLASGRRSFLPLTVLEKIIDELQPDIVIATNSPRAEQAALAVAKARGIPTLALIDLFGIGHFYPVDADRICVLTPGTIEHMLEENVKAERDAFVVLGNPAFDEAFDHRLPVSVARSLHLPNVPEEEKLLLWADMPAYWNLKKGHLHVRSDEEVLRDLDDLLDAAEANHAWLLVRPHPSQRASLHRHWLDNCKSDRVSMVDNVPLYPLLNSVDVVATYTSTVGVQALLTNCPVLQLKYHSGPSDLPLGEMGLAQLVTERASLRSQLQKVLYDRQEQAAVAERVSRLLPTTPAAPRIARLIGEMLQ